MSKNDADNVTMSAESIAFLEDVKKGKPRKFVMICKGTQVVSLVVYKKGNIESRRKEAKEAGRGQFYFGVIDGKGVDIRFVLARADGFESEPVKRTILKAYLEEQASLKVKPYFELVDVAPEFVDESGLDSPAEAATSPTTLDDGQIREAFMVRLKLMKPRIDACVTAGGPTGLRVKELAGQVGQLARAQQFGNANEVLDELEPLLRQEQVVPNASGFATRLKALMPAIAEAKESGTDIGREIGLKASEAATFARSQDFTNAETCLDRIEELLQQYVASNQPDESVPTRTASPTSVGNANDFATRLRAIKSELDKVLSDGGPLSGQAKLLASEAATFARRQDFVAALEVLDRIEQLLGSAPAQPSETAGVNSESQTRERGSRVALQQSVLLWDAARKRIESQLEGLETEILDLFADDPRFERVQANIHKLDAILGDFADDMRDRLDDAYQAEDDTRPKFVVSALSTLSDYRNYLRTDSFVQHVAINKLQPIDIEGILGKTLDDLEKRLRA